MSWQRKKGIVPELKAGADRRADRRHPLPAGLLISQTLARPLPTPPSGAQGPPSTRQGSSQPFAKMRITFDGNSSRGEPCHAPRPHPYNRLLRRKIEHRARENPNAVIQDPPDRRKWPAVN